MFTKTLMFSLQYISIEVNNILKYELIYKIYLIYFY